MFRDSHFSHVHTCCLDTYVNGKFLFKSHWLNRRFDCGTKTVLVCHFFSMSLSIALQCPDCGTLGAGDCCPTCRNIPSHKGADGIYHLPTPHKTVRTEGSTYTWTSSSATNYQYTIPYHSSTVSFSSQFSPQPQASAYQWYASHRFVSQYSMIVLIPRCPYRHGRQKSLNANRKRPLNEQMFNAYVPG